ncbi:MAG: lipopolysaccharide biosynthesis protein [Planctomycetota bacterium]
MDDLTRDTARNYLWNQAAVILGASCAFVLSVIVARVAGRVAFGTFGWVSSAVGLAALAGALGLKESAAVLVQRFHSNAPALRSLFARYFALRITSALVVGTALTALLFRTAGWSLALAAGAYALVLPVATLLSAFDIALFRTWAVTAGGIVALVIILPLGAAAAAAGSMPLVFASLAAGTLAASVVYLWPLRSLVLGPTAKTRLTGLFELPMVLWLIGFFNFLISALAALTLLKIAALPDREIASFTAGVYTAYWAQRMVVGGFANVILAAFSRAAMEGQGALSRIHSLYVRATGALTLPLIAGSIVFAPVLARIWLEGNTADAVAVARILGAFLLATRLAGGGAHSTALYSTGFHRQGLVIRGAFAGLAAVFVPLAGWRAGITGAAAVCGAIGLAVVVVEGLVLYAHRKVTLPWGELARLAASCALPAAAAAALLSRRSVTFVVLAVMVYIAVSILCLRLARPLKAGEADSIGGRSHFRALLAFFEAPGPRSQ